ncbi:MAG TPA: helix-hairpin-helix domain-containing protein, partial [Rubrivivax sp.]|nr:helix-hairpin-helix domain-containing protein [Rubrivivax sp.]
LVGAFGTAVFDVIEQTPARLREIDGIGDKRARKITSGWADQKVIRDIMVFLHAHGVSTSRAVRIFKTYGPEAIAVVQENPYCVFQRSWTPVSV